jgi:hypothetical protein
VPHDTCLTRNQSSPAGSASGAGERRLRLGQLVQHFDPELLEIFLGHEQELARIREDES